MEIEDIKEGKTYEIKTTTGKVIIAKLDEIQRSSIGDDYIFENISGAEELVKESSFRIFNQFPLPGLLLSRMITNSIIKEIVETNE